MPGVFYVAAQVAIHWPGELASIQQFVWDLQDHRFVATIGDRDRPNPLSPHGNETGDQHAGQDEVQAPGRGSHYLALLMANGAVLSNGAILSNGANGQYY
jgi:hypothetical protein